MEIEEHGDGTGRRVSFISARPTAPPPPPARPSASTASADALKERGNYTRARAACPVLRQRHGVPLGSGRTPSCYADCHLTRPTSDGEVAADFDLKSLPVRAIGRRTGGTCGSRRGTRELLDTVTERLPAPLPLAALPEPADSDGPSTVLAGRLPARTASASRPGGAPKSPWSFPAVHRKEMTPAPLTSSGGGG